MQNSVTRYSEEELAEFKKLIEVKMAKAQEQLDSAMTQIQEISENSDDEFGFDWMDGSSIGNEVELLNDMAIRQRKYIRELENALVRIQNKTYGICVVTGELIDKKRLMAVPTTTKSLLGKQMENQPQPVKKAEPVDEEDSDEPKPVKKAPAPQKRQIISKVIRKSSATTPQNPKKQASEEFEMDESDDLDTYSDPEIDLDSLADDDDDDASEEEF
ncbi:MAG: TraR/DksA family transcriptional regulator [Saprospiraceae bacterium]|nr:TraR/DksA family transcriptional regulator [Saprospiraceae bacterium]MCB0622623.1 TraR/DksA family transcriptional regulator [Saprospiraceae bacterium]MCB0681930.1 TraR/DksA family transcriptional regulator [Saprospiraceae bacterium]